MMILPPDAPHGLNLILASDKVLSLAAARRLSIVWGWCNDLSPAEARIEVNTEVTAHQGDGCATFHQTVSVAVLLAFEERHGFIETTRRVYFIDGNVIVRKRYHPYLGSSRIVDLYLKGLI